MSAGIHQVCAGAGLRDAITHHLLESQRVLRGMGLRSELFCEDERIDGALAGLVHPATRWDAVAQADDVALLHYSIASPAFEHVLARCRRTAIYYHNITPAELLWEDAPAVALQCKRGRTALAGLAARVGHAAAVSSFNAAELRALGFPDPRVVGVMRQGLPPAPARPRSDGRLKLLFVGRGAPNKAQHHLIATLAALRQAGADARLTLVGTWIGFERYAERCRRLSRRLLVEDHVAFAGSLDDASLACAYAESDCFVCLSDHEGYCVPLVEAMAAALPIVAYAAGAVPETVGRAGLLLDDKAPSLVAEATLAATNGEPGLAAMMAAGRREQLDALDNHAVAERLRSFVRMLA